LPRLRSEEKYVELANPTSRTLAAASGPVDDLAKRFVGALVHRSHGKSVAKLLLPSCDVHLLAYMAWRCVFDGGEMDAAIKNRGRKVTSHLRRHARGVRDSIHAEPASTAVARQGKLELDHVTEILRNASEKKIYNTKRFGVSINSYEIFIMREYMRARSGLVPKPVELAAILEAAELAAAPGRRVYFDPDVIRRNVRTFEKRNTDLCRQVRLRFGSPS
jgi:hypothetical protein